MAGTGEIYKRADGKYAFRVKAGNHEVVATDGGQGYDQASDAKSTLEKLMAGTFNGPVVQV
jgi:uncharacterized protein YegP (UPF0339 family)